MEASKISLGIGFRANEIYATIGHAQWSDD